MLTNPSIQEQYLTTYRLAECEAMMLCMVYADSDERVVTMMNAMLGRYAEKGVLLKLDRARRTVTLPNGSVVMYMVKQ